MDASNWIAIVLAAAALAGTAGHEWLRRRETRQHRLEDNKQAERSAMRIRVLELLIASDAGIRTVDALADGAASKERLDYLRRTATQLKVVGEDDLADRLRRLCDDWGSDISSDSKERLKREFIEVVRRRFGS